MLETLLATQFLLEPKTVDSAIHVPIEQSFMLPARVIHLDAPPSGAPVQITLETKGRDAQLKKAKQFFAIERKEREERRLAELKRKQEAEHQRKLVAEKKEQTRLQRLKEQSLALLKRKSAKPQQKPVLRKTATVVSNAASAEVTAYYAAPDAMQGGGITATGHNLYQSITYQGYRIVAAPPEIPFGSILEFNMNNGSTYRAVVLDRGGRIHNGVFDLALGSRQECINFGRQHGTYRVIGHIAY